MVKCLTWYSGEFGIWFSWDGAEGVSETDTVIVQDRIDVARFSSSSFFFFWKVGLEIILKSWYSMCLPGAIIARQFCNDSTLKLGTRNSIFPET